MKLRPNKYTNTDLSVIGLSIVIMKILEKNDIEKYDTLLRKVVRQKGDFARKNFVAALVFLFSIGKVNYYQESDTLEKVKYEVI